MRFIESLTPDPSYIRAVYNLLVSWKDRLQSVQLDDLREQLSMDFARTVPMPQLRDATKAQLARILTAWELALEHHSEHGGYLFGHFSLADCMYAPVVSRFVTFGVEVSPPVKSYIDRIMALPAMQDWGRDAQREVDAGVA